MLSKIKFKNILLLFFGYYLIGAIYSFTCMIINSLNGGLFNPFLTFIYGHTHYVGNIMYVGIYVFLAIFMILVHSRLNGKSKMNIILYILLAILIVYYCYSSFFIFKSIDFGPSPNIVISLPAFSEKVNVYNNFFGVPISYSSPSIVPSIYFIKVVYRVLFSIFLGIFGYTSLVKNKKYNKD